MLRVDSLPSDRPWLEHVWTTAGLELAQLNDFPRILETFKSHIRTYGKEDELPDIRSVRRYFANYIAAETRTGKRLREQIALWQSPKQSSETTSAKDSYTFEMIVNGKRTFLGGLPIPDDAPPRPSANAHWDNELKQWFVC